MSKLIIIFNTLKLSIKEINTIKVTDQCIKKVGLASIVTRLLATILLYDMFPINKRSKFGIMICQLVMKSTKTIVKL